AGQGAGPTYNLQLIYDTTMGQNAVGVNAGYRMRNPGTSVVAEIEPFKDQYIVSFAVSRMIESWRSKFITEVYAGFPAQSSATASDRELSSVELVGGIKHDLYESLALHAGGGTELLHGSSTADWRIYAGLNWVTDMLVRSKETTLYRKDKAGQLEYGYFGSAVPAFNQTPQLGIQRFVARNVLFEFDSADVKPEFAKVLGQLAEYVSKEPVFKKLTIEGHTDSTGPAAYNQDLSERRAMAARNVLIKDFGLPKEKVFAVGRGEEHPIADNTNWQGRAKNRRVEFIVER
ncbi:MAG: OmpA family protein, partial [Bdellovibrionales bacterium]|nr:OmpA family protein [Bdellovibrionales bacterium]